MEEILKAFKLFDEAPHNLYGCTLQKINGVVLNEVVCVVIFLQTFSSFVAATTRALRPGGSGWQPKGPGGVAEPT